MTKTCPHAASGCDYPASECAGRCASKQQPEALRLAGVLESRLGQGPTHYTNRSAAELRRLYKENADFRATCDHLTRENAEQIGEIVALKEQRDELLGALKDYDDAFTGFDPSSKESRHRMRQAVIKARAATAKAGGAA